MCSTPTKPTATSTERSGRLSPTGTLTSSPTNTTLRFSRCTTDPSTTRCVRAKTRFFSIVVKNHLPQPNMIPICLPANDNSLVGEVKVFYLFLFHSLPKVGTVTGWGRLSEYGQISPVLREVQLPIISNSKCMRMYRYETDQYILNNNIQQIIALGILVKTSGSQRSLCARAPHQGDRTAVRVIVEVPWW